MLVKSKVLLRNGSRLMRPGSVFECSEKFAQKIVMAGIAEIVTKKQEKKK